MDCIIIINYLLIRKKNYETEKNKTMTVKKELKPFFRVQLASNI